MPTFLRGGLDSWLQFLWPFRVILNVDDAGYEWISVCLGAEENVDAWFVTCEEAD